MSIINDALKKAQANLAKKEAEAKMSSENQENPQGEEPRKDPSQNHTERAKDLEAPEKQTEFIKQNLEHIEKAKVEEKEEVGSAEDSSAPEEIIPKDPLTAAHAEMREEQDKKKGLLLRIALIILFCAAAFSGLSYFLKKADIPALETAKIKATRALKKLPSLPKRTPATTQHEVPSEAELNTAVKQKSIMPIRIRRDILELNGIMTTGDKKVALINNEIYEVGDTVDGKEILKIEKDLVEIKDGEGTIQLKVHK